MTSSNERGPARLRGLEEHLSGGFSHRKWQFTRKKDPDDPLRVGERVAVLFFMDAEYDLVIVEYDFDGVIKILCGVGDCKWVSLDGPTLLWLADQIDEVEDQIARWEAGRSRKINKGWGTYKTFLKEGVE